MSRLISGSSSLFSHLVVPSSRFSHPCLIPHHAFPCSSSCLIPVSSSCCLFHLPHRRLVPPLVPSSCPQIPLLFSSCSSPLVSSLISRLITPFPHLVSSPFRLIGRSVSLAVVSSHVLLPRLALKFHFSSRSCATSLPQRPLTCLPQTLTRSRTLAQRIPEVTLSCSLSCPICSHPCPIQSRPLSHTVSSSHPPFASHLVHCLIASCTFPSSRLSSRVPFPIHYSLPSPHLFHSHPVSSHHFLSLLVLHPLSSFLLLVSSPRPAPCAVPLSHLLSSALVSLSCPLSFVPSRLDPTSFVNIYCITYYVNKLSCDEHTRVTLNDQSEIICSLLVNVR